MVTTRSGANTRKRSASAANLDSDGRENECPICMEKWDVNLAKTLKACCGKELCSACSKKTLKSCPFCRTPRHKDDDEYLTRLRRLVENNNPEATRVLARAYAKGHRGLAKDAATAAILYQRAADRGDVMAMNNLGCAYDYGNGVKLDKEKAVTYYRMAADRGSAHAQYNLGCFFATGDGVAKDDAEAFRFIKLAADQGHTNAEFNMGVMYHLGRGVARDLAEAKRWYERVAAKGHELAKTYLAELQREIEKIFAPDVAEATRLLARAAAAGHDKAAAALARL